MRVINLFGGPGSGKSTSAAALFAYLKNHGIRAELVGEEAKDQIYWGSSTQLGNQLLLAGLQYARLKNLERAGCQIAVADSPLIMGTVYSKGLHYYEDLLKVINKVNAEFHNINIFIRRTKPYDTFGRMQKDVDEAKVFDELIKADFSFDSQFDGDVDGQAKLCDWVLKLLGKE